MVKFMCVFAVLCAVWGCGNSAAIPVDGVAVTNIPPTVLPDPAPTSWVSYAPTALLWIPEGTWEEDIWDLPMRLRAMGVRFDTVSTLKGVDYTKYRAIIVPGGWAPTMAATTTAAQRNALVAAVKNGLNYLGHCAGGFLAGKGYGYPGFRFFNVAFDYPKFFYQGRKLEINRNTFADGTTRHLLYYWGPDLSPVVSLSPGSVVIGRFDNGAVSVVSTRFGKGRVVITAEHPESDQTTIESLGLTDPDGDDGATEKQLIEMVM